MERDISKLVVLRYKAVCSTMNFAKNKVYKTDQGPLFIVAETQQRGRGFNGSIWESPKGGFYGTLALHLDDKPTQEQWRFIHYITALSIVNTLKSFHNCDFKIKWPNDIYYKNMKLGGVLLEILHKIEAYVLIGIGVNLNFYAKELSVNKEVKPTSVLEITEKNTEIKKFEEKLLDNLLRKLAWVNSDDRSILVDQINSCLLNISLTHIHENSEYSGLGIDEKGFLRLKSKTEIISLPIEKSKEVSLVY